MKYLSISILACLLGVGIGCRDGSEIYSSVENAQGKGGASVGGQGGDENNSGSGGSKADNEGGSGGGSAAGGGGGSASGGANSAGTSGGGASGAGGNVATGGAGGMIAVGGAGGASLIGTPFKMLVFTKAVAFVHNSIPTCVQMLKDMGPANNFTVTETNDAAAFTNANLAQYAVVFFASTTGGFFSDAGAVGVTAKAAFQQYMENGGGYAGVHAATDCERDGRWPWYEDFMGALWSGTHHPDGTPGTVIMQPVDHPAVRGLPANWLRPNGEEWYRQSRNPEGRPGITILAKLASDQRPVSWIHDLPGGGRMFYTTQGHNRSYYAEPNLQKHILGGLLWAAKRAK